MNLAGHEDVSEASGDLFAEISRSTGVETIEKARNSFRGQGKP
jgi:hypothetical protein